MRRVWLWTILVVLASSGAAQAISVGLRDAATGSSTVQTTGPGDTVVLELYLDTEGLSFEGYYLGVDFIGGPLTIQSVAHQPLTGLFADLFGAPAIDGGAQTVRDINQTTFVSPLAAGEYVLDLITVQIGALAVGAVITATPGLFGQVVGAGGGSCPGTVEGCSVSVSSALIIPEPGTGLLLAASLLLLTLHRPEPSL